jgi:hypothetical protein
MRTVLCLLGFVWLVVRPAAADRVFSSGFELGSTANGVEWSTGPSLPQLTAVAVRTGGRAGLLTNQFFNAPEKFLAQRFSVELPPALDYYARCYVRFTTFPTNEVTFLRLNPARVSIDSSGVLRLRDTNGAALTGAALAPGVYYRIELRVFTGGTGGSDESRLRIDGFDDATIVDADYASTPITRWEVGRVDGSSGWTGEWRLDDCGINDTLGSDNNDETSWPGPGSIVHLLPNGEGDDDSAGNTLSQVGCSAITRDQCLNTLNDQNSYVGLDRSTSFVDVDVQDVLLPPDHQIQFVSVGIRFTCEGDRSCDHLVGVKSEPGGIVASSTTTIDLPAGQAFLWFTHSNVPAERRYRLTQYRDPQDATLRWTESTLNAMQLRVSTTDGNPDTNVTLVWALVEYEP